MPRAPGALPDRTNHTGLAACLKQRIARHAANDVGEMHGSRSAGPYGPRHGLQHLELEQDMESQLRWTVARRDHKVKCPLCTDPIWEGERITLVVADDRWWHLDCRERDLGLD